MNQQPAGLLVGKRGASKPKRTLLGALLSATRWLNKPCGLSRFTYMLVAAALVFANTEHRHNHGLLGVTDQVLRWGSLATVITLLALPVALLAVDVLRVAWRRR